MNQPIDIENTFINETNRGMIHDGVDLPKKNYSLALLPIS